MGFVAFPAENSAAGERFFFCGFRTWPGTSLPLSSRSGGNRKTEKEQTLSDHFPGRKRPSFTLEKKIFGKKGLPFSPKDSIMEANTGEVRNEKRKTKSPLSGNSGGAPGKDPEGKSGIRNTVDVLPGACALLQGLPEHGAQGAAASDGGRGSVPSSWKRNLCGTGGGAAGKTDGDRLQFPPQTQ